VPVTYYECVAVPGKQVVRQVSYTTVPRPVTYQVPVCTMSYCSVCDPCSGCCYTVCHPVTTWKTVHSTVYECVPAYKDVTIDVVTYKQVPRPGVQTVYECVPVPYDYVVNVVSCKLVPKPGMRTVYECVPRSRDVLVDVVNYQKVEKTAWVSYYVCEYVPKPTVVRQAYCVMQPYQYTVKVPVCVPVGCGSTCGYYGH
jgi:hypothetical protein